VTDLDFDAKLPVTELAPGATVSMMVSYTPRGGNHDQAVLTVAATSSESLVIHLTGYQDLTAPD
jgi:hypothetical protein